MVRLNYSVIRTVTFFSHSAPDSLSSLLISPKCRVLCVLFLGIGGAGGVERSRDDRPRDVGEWNEVAVYSPPAKATYLFRVALERGLKQHQRPRTQITCLGVRRRRRTHGGMWGRMEECGSHSYTTRADQFKLMCQICPFLKKLYSSNPFFFSAIFGQGSRRGRRRLYNTELRARVSFRRGNGRWLW